MGGFALLSLLLFLSAGFLFGEKGMKYAFAAWIVFMVISIVTSVFSEGTNVGIAFILTVVCSIMATAAIVRGIRKSRIMEKLSDKELADYGCTILVILFVLFFYLFGYIFKFLLL